MRALCIESGSVPGGLFRCCVGVVAGSAAAVGTARAHFVGVSKGLSGRQAGEEKVLSLREGGRLATEGSASRRRRSASSAADDLVADSAAAVVLQRAISARQWLLEKRGSSLCCCVKNGEPNRGNPIWGTRTGGPDMGDPIGGTRQGGPHRETR